MSVRLLFEYTQLTLQYIIRCSPPDYTLFTPTDYTLFNTLYHY